MRKLVFEFMVKLFTGSKGKTERIMQIAFGDPIVGIKDAGFKLIVHTDSVDPETDLTGEVLRDDALNLTLVRPVIHATKLEIQNG
jgi:hypothetical protein